MRKVFVKKKKGQHTEHNLCLTILKYNILEVIINTDGTKEYFFKEIIDVSEHWDMEEIDEIYV